MALFRSKKMAGQAGEWFYCVKHHKVEEGPECPSKDRLGPYPTREQAQQALKSVAARNEEWDNDPRWNDRGQGS